MGAPEDPLQTSLGELQVVLAQPGDAGDVVRLRDDVAAWMVERRIEQWRPGEIPLEWIEACLGHGWVHVVRVDDTLVASVTVVWEDPLVWGPSEDPAGYIHMLMVDRAYAGLQIGQSLLEWTENHIRGSGRALARLDCVRSNRRLRDYYERAGYRVVGYNEFPDVEWAFESVLYEKHLGR